MDAFSILAAPMAAAAQAEGGHDPQKLISFFAQEMQLFFGHIQGAVVAYTATGQLPHSIFSAKSVKAVQAKGQRSAKGEKKKGRRKPTAFNLYVKEKMLEMKAAGVQPPAAVEGEKKQPNPLFG